MLNLMVAHLKFLPVKHVFFQQQSEHLTAGELQEFLEGNVLWRLLCMTHFLRLVKAELYPLLRYWEKYIEMFQKHELWLK